MLYTLAFSVMGYSIHLNGAAPWMVATCVVSGIVTDVSRYLRRRFLSA